MPNFGWTTTAEDLIGFQFSNSVRRNENLKIHWAQAYWSGQLKTWKDQARISDLQMFRFSEPVTTVALDQQQ